MAFKLTKVVENESRKLAKKENNVIIFGLTEDVQKTSDDMVTSLLNDINLKLKISNSKRLKSTNGSTTGPIIIELNNADDKLQILKANKKIRQLEKYKSVYINPDLTKEERISEMKLREERNQLNKNLKYSSTNSKYGLYKFNDTIEEKFYWGIRNCHLCRIKISSERK